MSESKTKTELDSYAGSGVLELDYNHDGDGDEEIYEHKADGHRRALIEIDIPAGATVCAIAVEQAVAPGRTQGQELTSASIGGGDLVAGQKNWIPLPSFEGGPLLVKVTADAAVVTTVKSQV